MTTPDTKMLSAERLAELPVTARMLRAQGADLWPDVNESGQVHFGRAIMESAAEAIEAALSDIDALTARAAKLERERVEAGEAWRCFQCNEVFADREAARRHFGTTNSGVSCAMHSDEVLDRLRSVEAGNIELFRQKLALERDVREARDKALEEAATACEDELGKTGSTLLGAGMQMCITAIRALKPKGGA